MGFDFVAVEAGEMVAHDEALARNSCMAMARRRRSSVNPTRMRHLWGRGQPLCT